MEGSLAIRARYISVGVLSYTRGKPTLFWSRVYLGHYIPILLTLYILSTGQSSKTFLSRTHFPKAAWKRCGFNTSRVSEKGKDHRRSVCVLGLPFRLLRSTGSHSTVTFQSLRGKLTGRQSWTESQLVAQRQKLSTPVRLFWEGTGFQKLSGKKQTEMLLYLKCGPVHADLSSKFGKCHQRGCAINSGLNPY